MTVISAKNLKRTRFILGKKATTLLITKDLEGTSFIGVGRDTSLLFRTLLNTAFSANTRFYVDEDCIFCEHKVLLKNLQNNFGT